MYIKNDKIKEETHYNISKSGNSKSFEILTFLYLELKPFHEHLVTSDCKLDYPGREIRRKIQFLVSPDN